MDGGEEAGTLSPGEAEWPPELRLPPPPPPVPAPKEKEVPCPPQFDDSQFLGPIMEEAAAAAQPNQQEAAAPAAPVVVKRKRGRPPKNRDGLSAAPAKPVKKKEDNEEVVCFICFDGGNLVLCDRRGCSKAYHPACIKREESFFRSKGKWNCGWHICSSCEKAVHYMCYTCTYSLCKGCITQGKFFSVRGNKGFCDTCYGTIYLIESKDEDGAKVRVDFDDKNSWEYLFKLYWLDLKGKHSLTLDELVSAKSRWIVPSTSAKREKEESSDDLYEANYDHDDSSDNSSRKRKHNSSAGKRGRKRQKNGGITARGRGISVKSAESLPKRMQSEGMTFPGDTKWASPELLEFIGHMRNGDKSYISQFDVQVLLLEYIKQNNLRDPCRKSQIVCDTRLSNMFSKPRVGHFEMLKLLERHFHAKGTVNVDNQRTAGPESAQVDTGGYSEMPSKLCSDKRRKTHKNTERESPANLEDYAAIDMHNINLIYLRRSLMEELIGDDVAFSHKINGAFVRIRISGVVQKQDMYRLVKVLGTHKVAEPYNVGKKTTDYALEILNLDKKEVITMDTISNQDFTEEECRRLRRSMKCGIVTRLKVGDIHEKAKVFQQSRVNDWLENEKQRLSHLRDRASETGRKKELRECVEKLKLLSTPEERARRINDVPEVHADHCMAPNYESSEEWDGTNTVDCTISRNGSDLLFAGRKGTESNSVQNHAQKCFGAIRDSSSSPHTGSNTNLQSTNGWNIPQRSINLNNSAYEAVSYSAPEIASSDREPEKVWHYKDPSGNVQGPFTLSQLSNWASHFPHDMRVWLTFESEESSLLLTEVLSKQQMNFIQSTKSTCAGIGQDRSNLSRAEHNSSSPVGYNVIYSSGLPNPSAECSTPTREGPDLLGGTLPFMKNWEPLKDAHTLHGQAHHQSNYTCTVPSSAGSYGLSGSHDEMNNCQDSGGFWSPTAPRTKQNNVKSHPDKCTTGKQFQNDSRSDLLAGSVENLVSKMEFSSQKVPIPTPNQSEKDIATSPDTSEPSEFKTARQNEGSCWRSTTDPIADDKLQFSIASAKSESCSPAKPAEDGDSNSASLVPSQSGAPSYGQQSTPFTSILCNTEALNQRKACDPDALNAPAIEPPNPNIKPVLSPNTHDFERTCLSPTPKFERKEPLKDQSGSSTAIAPEGSATKAHDYSSETFVSETSGPSSGNIVSLQSLEETSCREERDLNYGGSVTRKEELKEGSTSFKSDSIAVNRVSDAEAIAVPDVLKSLTEQNCGTCSVHGKTRLEDFKPASAEEEQPQCSSPIALSPWGEPSYYQGEAVDSALWGVQDDPSNDMWSLSSPTPLQPSLGLRADGKDSSCIIEEEIVGRGNSAVVGMSPTTEDKKMEKGNSSASTGQGEPEQVKPKQSAQPSLEGSTKSSAFPLPGTPLEGTTKSSGLQLSGTPLDGSTKTSGVQTSSLEGNTKVSVWQPSRSSVERSIKASDRQPSGSSLEKSTKASGWQPWSSLQGSTKASGWQPSVSSIEGSTKTSGWERSSSSPDRNNKDLGWQRSSSSPERGTKGSDWRSSGERNTKSSGWQLSARESSKSKVNSTSSASQNRNTSSEAPRRQGNTNTNTDGWGDALGNNRSWHSSSANASRSRQSSHHRDRYSQERSEPWRGSSNHSRRSDHRQDHGSRGSSRSTSRGQHQRTICRYHENGHCKWGSSCQYLHR